MHDEMALSPGKPGDPIIRDCEVRAGFPRLQRLALHLPCGAEIDAAQAIRKPFRGLAKACRCT
jgi:hypothetical protein